MPGSTASSAPSAATRCRRASRSCPRASRARRRAFKALPKTKTTTVVFPGVSTFARKGKAVRTSPASRRPLEIFGSPTVTVPIAASGGWSRLVAVLTARTPGGKEIVVSAGGVPTRKRRAEGRDQARRPGDVPAEGIAAHADARVVVARAEPDEPPLPRPADGGERAGARRQRRPHDPGPAHADHAMRARVALAAASLALALAGGCGRRAPRPTRG